MSEDLPAALVLVLESGIPATRRNRIRSRLEELGVTVTVVAGPDREYLEIRGDHLPVETLNPEAWDGVERMISLAPEYPHAARHTASTAADRPSNSTVVHVGKVAIGGGTFTLIAGPCAVESADQALRVARAVAESGAVVLRAGVYKPRTSPYAFQGLQDAGLAILYEVKQAVGMPVVTEVMDTGDIEKVAEVADMIQVGSRNMQNYALLRRLGRIRKPILLKRGFAATLREFLLAAEYILSGGNDQIVLCERGIRSSAGSGNVVLDLGAVPELRRRTHLPVIVDPSHGGQDRGRVVPLARAAVAVGADGLLVEVHDDPQRALSDGQQALDPASFRAMVAQVSAIRTALSGCDLV